MRLRLRRRRRRFSGQGFSVPRDLSGQHLGIHRLDGGLLRARGDEMSLGKIYHKCLSNSDQHTHRGAYTWAPAHARTRARAHRHTDAGLHRCRQPARVLDWTRWRRSRLGHSACSCIVYCRLGSGMHSGLPSGGLTLVSRDRGGGHCPPTAGPRESDPHTMSDDSPNKHVRGTLCSPSPSPLRPLPSSLPRASGLPGRRSIDYMLGRVTGTVSVPKPSQLAP